jgi:hypothetical protein
MKTINNTNYIFNQLLKFDSGGYLHPQNVKEQQMDNELRGFLSLIDANLVMVPMSDFDKMQAINEFLKEKCRIYIRFVDKKPIMAGLIPIEKVSKIENNPEYMIIYYQLPKDEIRAQIRAKIKDYI